MRFERTATIMVDLATSSASLPVVGRALRPLGSITALALWGYRHVPEFATALVRTRFTPGAGDRRRRDRAAAAMVYRESVGEYDDTLAVPVPSMSPYGLIELTRLRRRFVQETVAYGSDPANRLDVWQRPDLDTDVRRPVLLFVPGGGWVRGRRQMQGYPLMSHLAQRGWVCLSMDYRVAPHHPWPAHIHDVKRALAWARTTVARYGGDPARIAIAGCSAGGHLASLAGLTANEPALQPGFERIDTAVSAVVTIYGRYDWESRGTRERQRFVDFLEHVIVKKQQVDDPETFLAASPIAQVGRDAPPFLVIHGDRDTVIPVAQARAFVTALRDVSHGPVVYAELPGTGHAFDLLDPRRTEQTVTAIEHFLTASMPPSADPRAGRPQGHTPGDPLFTPES